MAISIVWGTEIRVTNAVIDCQVTAYPPFILRIRLQRYSSHVGSEVEMRLGERYVIPQQEVREQLIVSAARYVRFLQSCVWSQHTRLLDAVGGGVAKVSEYSLIDARERVFTLAIQ